jgi:hypothetical protein
MTTDTTGMDNISAVTSTSRKISKNLKYEMRPQTERTYGKIEMDNHADTHALGSNCTIISYTGRSCNVAPFSEHYPPMKDIDIVSAATAYDDPITDQTTILIFHEALWLGSYMVDSLINPNQCRIYGISICDDPFDPHRIMGIYDNDNDIHIPLKMYGSTAAVETRSISLSELSTARHLVMCDNRPWEPERVTFPHSALRNNNDNQTDDYKISLVSIPAVKQIRATNDPDIPTIDMDTCSHNFVNQCIATVNVNTNAINTALRHSINTAEELARKWKIGLETARKNTQVHYSIWSKACTAPLNQTI